VHRKVLITRLVFNYRCRDEEPVRESYQGWSMVKP
jgi:hypothetical protein